MSLNWRFLTIIVCFHLTHSALSSSITLSDWNSTVVQQNFLFPKDTNHKATKRCLLFLLVKMSNLVLPHRSLEVIITEASVCLALNITSFIGNVMVCLAVFRNRNLRSTTNLYITALAISDLLCATVEMPLTAATLIIGRWDFGDALCQIQGFVDAFATYSTPATLCLLAFNRYIRIVKTNLYNRLFSPQKSIIWLCCMWLFLASYLLTGRVSNRLYFEFSPGYEVCTLGFANSTIQIVHFSIIFGFYFLLPFFIGSFSYYKVFSKTSEHELHMASSLRQSASDSIVRSSVREINITRVLLYIAAGFLCSWIPLWIIIFWRRFSPDTCPRAVALTCTMLLFVSASINPFIYMFTNGEFQREFRKLLRCRREARMVPAEILEVGDIER